MLNQIKNKYRNWVNTRGLVLMYHRVASEHIDPWRLAITPRVFKEQLAYLATSHSVVSIDKFLEAKASSERSKAITITFDDGYQDNLTTALPILEELDLPATFFISSHYLQHQVNFWWDTLEYCILHSDALPLMGSFNYKSVVFYWDFSGDLDKNLIKDWDANTTEAPNARAALYYQIWAYLIRQVFTLQQSFLKEFQKQYAIVLPANFRKPMTETELKVFANHPLVTIGGHTLTHTALPQVPAHTQLNEIVNNQEYLQKLTDSPIGYFSFPYGKHATETEEIIKKGNWKASFTTHAAAVKCTDSNLTINRCMVTGWPVNLFKKQLRAWNQ